MPGFVVWEFPTIFGVAAVLGTLVVAAGAVLVHLSLKRRLATLAEFLEAHANEPDGLRRLPDLGRNEVGRAARAVNDLLRTQTGVRVSLIDQGLELAQKQRELELLAALADKSRELSQRLSERALLFDLLRDSADSQGLDQVLSTVARRLGDAMGLREVALLVREADRFVVRAAHGFEAPDRVVGKSLVRGEGVSGAVADAREPLIVGDVREDHRYLAFWGEAPREGSFAAVPVRDGERTLGILALTRPADAPLSEPEVRFLSAIADTIALAIRHAQLVDELRELSTHDALTGLANRRLFDAQLAQEVERSHRYGSHLSVLLLDLDHFKRWNDRFGHAAGDDVLRTVSRELEHAVRRVDTVARIGGEELVVLLPRTDLAAACGVADKLRKVVSEVEIASARGARVTVSIGVAELCEGDTPERLLERADVALYRAKANGRDRIEMDLSGRARRASSPPTDGRPRALA